MACAQSDRIGTFPKLCVLGASFQIQSFTLHLATLAYRPCRLRVTPYTTGRLTKPYPDRPMILPDHSCSTGNHCQVTPNFLLIPISALCRIVFADFLSFILSSFTFLQPSAPCYHATFYPAALLTSASILSPIFFSAKAKSYLDCRLIQNCALLPK